MERCGFFDANLVGEEYDRVYLAAQFAAYFASFIGNGVYAEHSNQLQVVAMPTPQMQVGVEKGQGWINGYWYENTDMMYLPIEVADGVLNRIDSIVLRLGFAERNMWLMVKKGTPAINPIAPEVTRTADYYDLQLATISIPASSIKITQAQITDTRMNQNVCGWVTGVVDQLDTTTLFNQFETYFQEFKENNQADFDTWFESIKGQLSGDVAGRLTEEVNNLTEQVEQLTDKAVTPQERNKWNTPGDIINGTLTVWQRYDSSSSATYTNPSNAYVADRFRSNGTGTVQPNARGYGADITGTITMQYWMEKADFALLPDPVVVYYSVNGQMQTASTAKSSVQTDSGGNACIFSQAITNQTLDWVSLYPGQPVRPYVEEFALCQRYYQNLAATGIWLPSSASAGTCYYYFPVQNNGMRVTPTAPQTASGAVFGPAGWNVTGTVSVTDQRLSFAVSNASGQTARTEGSGRFQVTLDAEIY